MYSNIIMSITLNINEEDYPEIYKLYKKTVRIKSKIFLILVIIFIFQILKIIKKKSNIIQFYKVLKI